MSWQGEFVNQDGSFSSCRDYCKTSCLGLRCLQGCYAEQAGAILSVPHHVLSLDGSRLGNEAHLLRAIFEDLLLPDQREAQDNLPMLGGGIVSFLLVLLQEG